ncbi:SDR family oxidoreductase [Edaphovirga cremea]|uniref:SDR family oxidoreductase n=1 Tax=Edaphovirga cremea TaxID=2267246 RepID=UPI00398A45CB
MKKVTIVGLGWLGMPLAVSLAARGIHVVGSKTTPDGVDAARMTGIECYQLELTPDLICEADDLDQLLDTDALVITLPARRTVEGNENYFRAVQMLVDSALAHAVKRIVFTSSTSVYGTAEGTVKEDSPLKPETASGEALVELERWLHKLPNTSVDILRLAGLVGAERHPGRFLAGKTGVRGGSHGVNLVHQDDVVAAIQLLLRLPKGGHIYNLCAPGHPAKNVFYPMVSDWLNLPRPTFDMQRGDEGQGKIVDGSRICKELGFEYEYPDPLRMPVS